MTNQNVDFPHLTADGSSGSTQFPNLSGNINVAYSGQRTVVMPSPESSLPPVSPYFKISTVQQRLEYQNFNNTPTITTSMSQSSSTLFPLPPRSPSSTVVQTQPRGKAQKRSNTDDVSFGSGSASDEIRKSKVDDTALNQFFDQIIEEIEGNERNKNGESSVNTMGNETATSSNHLRGLSVDTGAVEMFNDGFESSKPPLSPGIFSPTYGTTMFSATEMNKFAGNNRLSDLLAISPKKYKRKLANRESAARSKQRKEAYISGLETEVKTVKAKYATLQTKYNQLQEVSEKNRIALVNENRELKIRLDGMEKQAQLQQEQAQLHQALIDQLNARLSALNIN